MESALGSAARVGRRSLRARAVASLCGGGGGGRLALARSLLFNPKIIILMSYRRLVWADREVLNLSRVCLTRAGLSLSATTWKTFARWPTHRRSALAATMRFTPDAASSLWGPSRATDKRRLAPG